MEKVKLFSYWSWGAVSQLLEKGSLSADGGLRMFEESFLDNKAAQAERDAYDFIAEHTPNCSAMKYPLWAWMYPQKPDKGTVGVIYTKKVDECCFSSFDDYSNFFMELNNPLFTDEEYDTLGEEVIDSMRESMTEEEIRQTWAKCLRDSAKSRDTQVTFAELKISEVKNLGILKAKLALHNLLKRH